ncbi:hypothetical protein PanWU01x14_295800, partial [Parasponia andersonii]
MLTAASGHVCIITNNKAQRSIIVCFFPTPQISGQLGTASRHYTTQLTNKLLCILSLSSGFRYFQLKVEYLMQGMTNITPSTSPQETKLSTCSKTKTNDFKKYFRNAIAEIMSHYKYKQLKQ